MEYNFSIIAGLDGVTNVYNDDIPKYLLVDAVKTHELSLNATILYLWKSDISPESLVITKDFISAFNNCKRLQKFDFSDLNRVYFSPDTLFYLYDTNDNRIGTIPGYFFGHSKGEFDTADRELIKEFFNSLIYNHSFRHYDNVIDEIEELANNEYFTQLSNNEQANKIIEIYKSYSNDYGRYFRDDNLLIYIARAYSVKKDFFKCLNVIDYVLQENFPEMDIKYWYEFKIEILIESQLPLNAEQQYIEEVKFMLGNDRIIGDTERRVLTR